MRRNCAGSVPCKISTRLTAAVPQRTESPQVGLLGDIVEAVGNDTVLPPDALGLVNLTSFPVYRVINGAAAYRLDNVPIGLALFASLTPEIGDGLTAVPSPASTVSASSA